MSANRGHCFSTERHYSLRITKQKLNSKKVLITGSSGRIGIACDDDTLHVTDPLG